MENRYDRKDAILPLHEAAISLQTLPADVMGAIMSLLRTEDITSISLSSKTLYRSLHDDGVWYHMCKYRWGERTDVTRWLVPPDTGPSPSQERMVFGTPTRFMQSKIENPSELAPVCYRDVYVLLNHIDGLIGVWRDLDGAYGPSSRSVRTQLVVFSWGEDGIDGHRIMYDDFNETPQRELWERISPREGRAMRVEYSHGGDLVALQAIPHAGLQRSGSNSGIYESQLPDEIAEAAAVAAGSSPGSSLGNEFVEFMASNIKRRSAKMKRRRSGRQQSVMVRHLSKVDVPPRRGSQHTLSGVWLSERIEDDASSDVHASLDIVEISYDFSGKEARVVAAMLDGESRQFLGGTSGPVWVIAAAARRYVAPGDNNQTSTETVIEEIEEELEFAHRSEANLDAVRQHRHRHEEAIAVLGIDIEQSRSIDESLDVLGPIDSLVIESDTPEYDIRSIFPECYHEGFHVGFDRFPELKIRMYEFSKDVLKAVSQGSGGLHNFMTHEYMIRLRRIDDDLGVL